MAANLFSVIIGFLTLGAGAYLSTLESSAIRIAGLALVLASILGLIVWTLWNYGRPRLGPALLIIAGSIMLCAGLGWHFIQSPSAQSSQGAPTSGKGGDSSGSGGAGGGGISSPGGNSSGTGGAGGGGSAVAGGGGGGGEGAQGGTGGVGAGGGGGGKGAPGGSGGPGAIIISYVPVALKKAPDTLFQNYQIDAYSAGFAGRSEIITSGPNGTIRGEVHLSWGPNCGPTTLWLYIPETKFAYEQSEQFLAVYRQALVKLDMQRKLPLKSGCASAPSTSPEMRFSKKVFIYSQTDLPRKKIEALHESYANNDLELVFRSAQYLAERKASWTSKKNEQPKEVVVMMVGDDAPL